MGVHTSWTPYGGKVMKRKVLLVLMAVVLAVVGFTGCAGSLLGDVEEVSMKYGSQKVYVFDSTDKLAKSLGAIEKKEYGQITFGGFEKEFNSQKDSNITYEKEDDSGLNYAEIGRPVVAFKQNIRHVQSSSSLGMGYVMEKYTLTGGVRIYVWSDSEQRWSDPWDFDFGCKVN